MKFGIKTLLIISLAFFLVMASGCVDPMVPVISADNIEDSNLTDYSFSITGNSSKSFTYSIVDSDGNDLFAEDTEARELDESGSAIVSGLDFKNFADGKFIITITVYVNSKNILSSELEISKTTVLPLIQPTSITLDKNSEVMFRGAELNLTANILPENSTDMKILWSSNDEIIAVVSDTGVVSALTTGVVTISAITRDGEKQDECEITVNVGVDSVTLDAESQELLLLQTFTLKATVLPVDATDSSIVWESSDVTIATVDIHGVVTAEASGSATIFAYSADRSQFASCVVTVPVPVTDVTLDQSSATLNRGLTLTLNETIIPAEAADKGVYWISSDETIATVSTSGVVSAIKIGTATITVHSDDGNHTAICDITVEAAVTGVSLNTSSTSLVMGEDETLLASIEPADATHQNVTWSSSSPGVASVSTIGLIETVGVGSSIITVTTVDGAHTDVCTVTVTAAPISVVGVSLDQTTYSIRVTNSFDLTETISPSNATNKAVVWSSSDDAIATVSSLGHVEAKLAGEATITVTTDDGAKIATCVVTVTPAVSGVTLNIDTLQLELGSNSDLTETVSPSDAADQSVSWSSSDEAVATVSVDGLVQTLTTGSTIITATTTDGLKTATCDVTVVILVTDVTLDQSSATLNRGSTLTLNETIIPGSATEKGVTWSSSDETIATVSTSGVVSAIKIGTATITVNSDDGNHTAPCVVTVEAAVTGVSLNTSSTSLVMGEDETLVAAIEPVDATNQNVTWTSSSPSVVSVSTDGLVETVGVGSSTITVTTVDGSYTDVCTVTVTAAPISVVGVSLDETTYSIRVTNSFDLTETISPSNATNKAVVWSSSDGAIATVSSLGHVEAKVVGEATITVTTADGAKIATCVVTVAPAVSGVVLNTTTLLLDAGTNSNLTATVSPFGALDQSVTWSSANSLIATVTQSGLVEAISSGTVNITVTTADGGKTDVCSVLVNTAPTVSGNTSATTIESTPIVISKAQLLVNATDSEGDAMSPVDLVVTSNGSVVSNGNDTWTINPTNYYAGALSLTYNISDGRLKSSTQLDLTISEVADEASLSATIENVASPIVPVTGAVTFASATSGVIFDNTIHIYQNVGGGISKEAWDTSDVTGSGFDDQFVFSQIAGGESYIINGGVGTDIINLSGFSSEDIKIETVDFSGGTTTITIDIDGDDTFGSAGDAVITATGFEDFDFSKAVFTGVPHGLTPVLRDNAWTITAGTEIFTPEIGEVQGVWSLLLLEYAGTLAENYNLNAVVHAQDIGIYENGAIIFDYVDPDNYKAVVARIGANKWSIEQVSLGVKSDLANYPVTLNPGVDNPIELRVVDPVDNPSDPAGSRAELWTGGTLMTYYEFHEALNDGRIGIADNYSRTTININMAPSNWAPAVKDYSQVLETQNGSVTFDVLTDAVDHESEILSISSITQPANGTAVDNGNGTITYTPDGGFEGLDSLIYTVTDGINFSDGIITADVQDNSIVIVTPGAQYIIEATASLTDSDGSETISILLERLPLACYVTDGSNNYTAGSDDDTLDITSWNYSSITFTSPMAKTSDYTIDLTAKTEESGGTVASVTRSLSVQVDNTP